MSKAIRAVAAMVVLVGSLVASTRGAEPSPPVEGTQMPETFTGLLQVVGGPGGGMVNLRVTVERWSTPEERQALAEALRAKGTDGLVAALDELNMGRFQIDNNLANPVRLATSWQTEKGRVIRLATNRRIGYGEMTRGARSEDYPFGFVEFLLPPDGKGEGTLIAAAKAQFGAEGRLEIQSLPSNTSAQRLTEIEREVPKPKKVKKKKE